VSYLGGCGSCGPQCGCRSCRSTFGERYEREEEEQRAPAPRPERAPGPAPSRGLSGLGFAYATPPRRRRILVRRRIAPPPSVRQLQEEVRRLRQQLRALSLRSSTDIRMSTPPGPPEEPQQDAAPPERSAPEAAPADSTPPDATPPEAGTSGGFGEPAAPPSIVKVRGIRVAIELAPRLAALLAAADVAGVPLSGSGYRSRARQIELRRRHCGPTHYDIWQRRSSECRPPTATPGRSMHERGLAIDFTQNGRALTRESSGFQWLLRNAARFGLKNLPSEPWHWSVNGR
jgi:hypothetical protein